MTPPRRCPACGATLPPDVRWCVRCYAPVRELTPRDPPLPPLADVEEPPAHIARWAPLPHVPPPREYSRWRGGPTTFGPWGRIGLSALVVLFFPWGPFTGIAFFYLLGYIPTAAILLWGIWRKGVVEPPGASSYVVPDERMTATIRMFTAVVGVALLTVALATALSPPLAALPTIPLLVAASSRTAWKEVVRLVAWLRVHPIVLLVIVNALNALDALMSSAAIHAGNAAELNPLVSTYGDAAKIVLVAGCSVMLYMRRPDALIWPAAAFLALAAYHITGYLANV